VKGGVKLREAKATTSRSVLLALMRQVYIVFGIRTLCDRVTRGYGDHSPSRPTLPWNGEGEALRKVPLLCAEGGEEGGRGERERERHL